MRPAIPPRVMSRRTPPNGQRALASPVCPSWTLIAAATSMSPPRHDISSGVSLARRGRDVNPGS